MTRLIRLWLEIELEIDTLRTWKPSASPRVGVEIIVIATHVHLNAEPHCTTFLFSDPDREPALCVNKPELASGVVTRMEELPH